MSTGPDKIATALDLFQVNGAAGFGTSSSTRAYDTFAFPPGKKAVAISVVTSATVTLNVQNSLDKVNWFNVLIATNTSVLAEVDSIVPFWRLNVTSFATLGTGAAPAAVARMAQLL